MLSVRLEMLFASHFSLTLRINIEYKLRGAPGSREQMGPFHMIRMKNKTASDLSSKIHKYDLNISYLSIYKLGGYTRL